ncbi:FAD binding domain-containing protein [Profundibacter sp.]
MAYFRPTDLKQAYGILADTGAKILAGGTDIFPAQARRELRGEVLDISAISELGGITQTKAGWRIGATTTWSEIAKAPLPPALAALQQAAREVGSLQIQNSATIAGNLCNASPAADGVPPLLVLEAEVEIGSLGGGRRLPLSEFITGVRETALKAGEIVTALHIPQGAAQGTSAFRKLGARKYLVISICMVAARLELVDGVIRKAAISVGSCSPVARRLPDLETALIGYRHDNPAAWQDVLEQQACALLSPIADIRADAEYRKIAAIELVNRTISDASLEGTL